MALTFDAWVRAHCQRAAKTAGVGLPPPPRPACRLRGAGGVTVPAFDALLAPLLHTAPLRRDRMALTFDAWVRAHCQRAAKTAGVGSPTPPRPGVRMRRTGGMTVPALDALLARIVDSGLLDEPVAKDGLVHARATVDAARTAVTVTVDPEFEDYGDDVDEDALLEAISRILSVNESRWRAVVDEVAAEIEDDADDPDKIGRAHV